MVADFDSTVYGFIFKLNDGWELILHHTIILIMLYFCAHGGHGRMADQRDTKLV